MDTLVMPTPKRATKDEIVFDREAWEEFCDLAEVIAARTEDRLYAATLPTGTDIVVPHEVVVAKAEGRSPLAAWRAYRGFASQQALAEAAGVARDMIAQIEARKRRGAVETLRRLAVALRVPIEAIAA